MAVIEAVPNTPVTVKMRAGWDSDSIIVSEVGGRLQNIGVQQSFKNYQTKVQRKSKLDLIKILKEISLFQDWQWGCI